MSRTLGAIFFFMKVKLKIKFPYLPYLPGIQQKKIEKITYLGRQCNPKQRYLIFGFTGPKVQ